MSSNDWDLAGSSIPMGDSLDTSVLLLDLVKRASSRSNMEASSWDELDDDVNGEVITGLRGDFKGSDGEYRSKPAKRSKFMTSLTLEALT